MPNRRPPLTVAKILAWADAHYRRSGSWPMSRSGAVKGAPNETWWGIDAALIQGHRGMPGGDTLPQLLARKRGRHNPRGQPPLRVTRILAWANAHRRRTGRWPGANSGPVRGAPGLTWRAVNLALSLGYRGLPGGDSLARLLARRRGRPSYRERPRLSVGQVLAWAEAYRARRGRWPTAASGEIAESPGTTWMAVNAALSRGLRGLPAGLSLSRLLRGQKGTRTGRTG
jgi:hypothetical protein